MTQHLRALAFVLFSLAIVAETQTVAAQTQVPSTRAEIGLSFAPVVKSTAPAVVNIFAKQIEGNDPPHDERSNHPSPSQHPAKCPIIARKEHNQEKHQQRPGRDEPSEGLQGLFTHNT